MNVTLRQLRAFIAVAQFGGFTAAAERLHLTQSALSVMIRDLEGELGLRLFDRTTRRVELTEAGREFFPIAEKTLEDLTSAVAHSRELAAIRRGRVTVAATTLVSSLLLPRAIAAYGSRFPGVKIVLRDGAPAGQIAGMVQDGAVDIGIGPLPGGRHELDAATVIVDTLELACPRAHALARKSRATWRDLAGEPLVALSGDSGIRQLIEERLAAVGVEARPDYDVAFLATAIGLVDAGLGIAVLPSHARPLAGLYHIAFVKLVAPTVRREIRLLTRRGRVLSPAARSFRDFLVQFGDIRRDGAHWLDGFAQTR